MLSLCKKRVYNKGVNPNKYVLLFWDPGIKFRLIKGAYSPNYIY